jgi:hypothetical protein
MSFIHHHHARTTEAYREEILGCAPAARRPRRDNHEPSLAGRGRPELTGTNVPTAPAPLADTDK